jgi:tRNA(Arg) A34 adenosine deaminase TadA
MDPSRKIIDHFNRAAMVASQSPMDVPVGAVMSSGGKILAEGHNMSRGKMGNFIGPSIHAEMASIYQFLQSAAPSCRSGQSGGKDRFEGTM